MFHGNLPPSFRHVTYSVANSSHSLRILSLRSKFHSVSFVPRTAALCIFFPIAIILTCLSLKLTVTCVIFNVTFYPEKPRPLYIVNLALKKRLGINNLCEMINVINKSGEMLENHNKSIFLAMKMRAKKNKCKVHRTIRLMSKISKLIIRILMNRAHSKFRLTIE